MRVEKSEAKAKEHGKFRRGVGENSGYKSVENRRLWKKFGVKEN